MVWKAPWSPWQEDSKTGPLPPLPQPCSSLPTSLDRPRSPGLGLGRLRPWVRHPGEGLANEHLQAEGGT